MAFQLVQILYWLALATWFGGALFVTVAHRVIVKTIEENHPILPHVLSVNLEGQHGTLLAGTIMGNILATFLRIELGCWAILVASLAGQAFFIDLHDQPVLVAVAIRATLICAAGIVVLYDWRMVWPKMWRHRQEFLDHADEPEVANPAKDQFDRFQNESVSLLQIKLFLLLGTVLFSGAMAFRTVGPPIAPPTPTDAQPHAQLDQEHDRGQPIVRAA